MPPPRQSNGSTAGTLFRGCLYLCSLYAWWCVCAHYFMVAEPPKRIVPLPSVDENPPTSEAAVTAAAITKRGGMRSIEEPAEVAAAAEVVSETKAAATEPAAAADMTAATASAAAAANCPATRRPYHTLLTAQGSIYNQWQARIMYHHWKKQRARDGPCTEMSGFTRLCPSPHGQPDGVEKYIPTIFVEQLSTEVLAKYGHFGVLNRPHSVVEFFKNPVRSHQAAAAHSTRPFSQPRPLSHTHTHLSLCHHHRSCASGSRRSM